MATVDPNGPHGMTYARRASLHYERHPNKAHDLRMGMVAVLVERTVDLFQPMVGNVTGTDTWELKMFARIHPRTKLGAKAAMALYGVELFTSAIVRVLRVATPRGTKPENEVLDTLWLDVYNSVRKAFDEKKEGDQFSSIDLEDPV